MTYLGLVAEQDKYQRREVEDTDVREVDTTICLVSPVGSSVTRACLPNVNVAQTWLWYLHLVLQCIPTLAEAVGICGLRYGVAQPTLKGRKARKFKKNTVIENRN